jgi:DnaJ-class molecular chaperone
MRGKSFWTDEAVYEMCYECTVCGGDNMREEYKFCPDCGSPATETVECTNLQNTQDAEDRCPFCHGSGWYKDEYSGQARACIPCGGMGVDCGPPIIEDSGNSENNTQQAGDVIGGL